MYKRRVWSSQLAVIIGSVILLAGCDPEAGQLLMPVTISGEVSIGSPVTGASLDAFSEKQLLASARAGVDDAGRFGPCMVLTPGQPFRVQITGGTINGEPFEGTLSAYVPANDLLTKAYDSDWDYQDVKINILSTCVDRYMRATGADYQTARERVAGFFEIPDGQRLLDENISAQEFSSIMFQEQAAAYGSFDDYIDSLVERIDGSETEPMMLSAQNSFSVVKYDLGTLIAYQMLTGLGAQVAKMAFPEVLSAIGFGQEEQDISGDLAEIKAELAEIKNDMSYLKSESKRLLATVQQSSDQLANDIKQTQMQQYTSFLEEQYDMMMGDRNQTPTAAKRFADSFPYQMNQNVIWIRDLMCGSSLYGSKGTLEALADVLAHDVYNASDRGAKLLQSYYTLEMYFSYLLATQMKGAFIEANLRDYWDTEDGTEGSAAAYIQDKIIPMVEQEADYFLLAVEKLVISSADVRSPMASDYSMFPREAVQQVFERADFLAHQLSSRHPGGLVIRVIGDRQLVEQCLTAPKNETHFGTPDVITIPSDGDAVRNYTPYFPESLVSAGKYVAWEPVDSMKLYDDQPEVVEAIWKFYVNSKVAVARLSFPRQRYPFTDQHLRMAPFTRTYKFAHSLTTRVRYMRRSMKSGRELRSSSSDEVLFGHGVVFARFMPEFAHAQPEFLEASDDKFRYETDWNCTTGRIVEVVEVKKAYTGGGKKRGTWISHSRRPFMLCHIVNGDSSSRTLKLAYKGRIESKADGFKNATTDTHWDSSRDFEITLGTDCQIGEPAMSRIGWGANREFPTVDGLSRNRIFDCRTRSSSKTAQENLDNSTTQTWTSGQVFTIKHCLSIYNCVNAYAARTLPFTDDLSDKGSTVTTTLELDSLEFIPQ